MILLKVWSNTARGCNHKYTAYLSGIFYLYHSCSSSIQSPCLTGMMRMHTTLQSDATGYMPSFDVVVDPVFSNYSGFKQLDYSDQQMIVRLGQSASRILVASVNWYNADTRSFEDFLAWRNDEDLFKRLLFDCAAKISELRLEESDVAILNYLLLVGTGQLHDCILFANLKKNCIVMLCLYRGCGY